ncbi:MAG: DUF3450 domain-containing protein [Halioglobus sp.]
MYKTPLLAAMQQVAMAAMVAVCATGVAVAQDIEDSLEVVSDTTTSAVKSQQKVDALSRETRLLLEEYRSLKDSVEYQEAYTRELRQLDASQRERVESLNQQIAQARITRQRILPLMRSMVDALESFVVLDLPFHREQRLSAVVQLKQRLDRADISVSARFRLLLEAYQIEQGYSGSVEAWRGPLQDNGEIRSVEYLRLGRVALYYQSLDRLSSGYWDKETRSWVPLEAGRNRSLSQAMRVARSQTAPQLLTLPLLAQGDQP